MKAAVMPVATAVRKPGRTILEPSVWVVRRCAFCSRRHTHIADPVMTELILPARCNPTKFYAVREVSK